MKRKLWSIPIMLILGICLTNCDYWLDLMVSNEAEEELYFSTSPLVSAYPDTTFKYSYIKSAYKVDGMSDNMQPGRAVIDSYWSYRHWDDVFDDLGVDRLMVFIWRGYQKDKSELGEKKLQILARYDLSAQILETSSGLIYPPSPQQLDAGMKVTLIPEEESDSYPGFLEAYAPGRASEE